MPNVEISQIQLPNGDLYDIRDGNVSDFKTNINEETLSNGQVVKYNEETGEWENEEDKTEYVGSASGAVATFTTDAALPLKSFECEIVAKQESGAPTPDNPLLITGFSQADIPVMGKNLIDDSKYYQASSNTVVVGQTLPNSNRTIFLKAGTYTIKVEASVAGSIYYDFGNGSTRIGSTSEAGIFTLLNDSWCVFSLYKSGGFSPSDYTSVQLEFGSTATNYETYNGNTYLVEFDQTIYGGKLIYQNGQWAIEATYVYADLSSLAWSYQSAGERFVSSSIASTVKAPPSNDDVANIKCSILQTTYANNTSVGGLDNSIGITSTSKNIVVKATSAGTTQADLRAFLDGCDFIYELATPIIIPLTSTVKVKTIAGLNNIYSSTGDVNLEYYKNVIPAQSSTYDNTSSGLNSTDVQSAIDELSEHGLEITKTAGGTVASFSDGGDNIPVKLFECEIVAHQESGTPTPDSPLLITGFSQADISVFSFNIFDEEMEVGTLNNSTGEPGTDANKMRSVNFIPVKPNTTYGVYNNTGVNLYIYSYKADKSFIAFDNTGMVTGSTFTTDSNTYYIKFRTQNNPSYNNNISINYPSTNTDYHAYTGGLYTVSFGRTIYGGRLIYSNGQWAIEATHGYKLFDGTENWNKHGTIPSWFYVDNVITDGYMNSAEDNFQICNLGIQTKYNDVTILENGHFVYGSANKRFIFKNTDYTEVADFQTWLNNNNMQVCYKLATPVIIPLTSTVKVKTIAGLNNIYSNTGDVSLEYFVNKADDIDKLINAEKSTESSDYHVYSTDEQVVGKWIDGNDIYEKTISISNATIRVSGGYSYDISGWNVDVLVKSPDAYIVLSSGTDLRTVPFGVLGSYAVEVYASRSAVSFARKGADLTCDQIVFTLRYTKTSSNTRSLNLSKGSSEEIPVEEKKEELKELEEVKEVQDE